MTTNRHIPHHPLLALALLLLTAACQKKLQPASVEIVDPIRHYYPVLQGETLGVTYEIENTSSTTLFIQEIQTTCGCIVPLDKLPIVILPHKKDNIRLTFNSTKNSGYVTHYIWCYGNFTDSIYRELRFDTNIVPSADYIRDYEQLYHEQMTHSGSMRDFVDGKTSNKGYYTDKGDPRALNRESLQDKIDNLMGY